jgi:hypothetical protein
LATIDRTSDSQPIDVQMIDARRRKRHFMNMKNHLLLSLPLLFVLQGSIIMPLDSSPAKSVKTWLSASVVKFLSSKFDAIGSLCLESVETF